MTLWQEIRADWAPPARQSVRINLALLHLWFLFLAALTVSGAMPV